MTITTEFQHLLPSIIVGKNENDEGYTPVDDDANVSKGANPLKKIAIMAVSSTCLMMILGAGYRRYEPLNLTHGFAQVMGEKNSEDDYCHSFKCVFPDSYAKCGSNCGCINGWGISDYVHNCYKGGKEACIVTGASGEPADPAKCD